MSANAVNAWDLRALVAGESPFGTAATPIAASAIECADLKTGPNENGVVRPKRDRSLGRGMQSGFIEGDVVPMDWMMDFSVKSRSAIDADPREIAILKAAGMKRTQNVSTSLVMSMSTTPIESLDFVSATIQRYLGAAQGQQSEVLRGCVCKKLQWSGGSKEVTCIASGSGIGKNVLGTLDSITLASGVVTTLNHTAAESYKLSPGYYQCESEIIQITAVTYGGTSSTIVRGALASSAVAHTAKRLSAYLPPGITFAGSPIAEPNATVSLGSIAPLLLTEWSIDFTTGLDLLPHETSSKYIRGPKAVRYNVDISMKAVLTEDRVDLQGLANQRVNQAVSIAQGIGTGSIITFAAANTEVVAFSVDAPANDIAIVDVKLRVRDSGTGSDMFTVTYT